MGGGVEASKGSSNASLATLNVETSPAIKETNNELKNKNSEHNNNKPKEQVGDKQSSDQANNKTNEAENKQQRRRPQPVVLADTSTEETVRDADSFIQALQKTNINTINIGADISFKDKNNLPTTTISHDITIKGVNKADGGHYGLDFNNEYLNGSNHNVTFENIDLYDKSDNGLIKFAGTVTFDNVNFKGKTMVNNGASTINFKDKIEAETVKSYVFGGNNVTTDAPTNNKEYQQNQYSVIYYNTGSVNITFEDKSNVKMTTVDGTVIDVLTQNSHINISNGSNVTLNPHEVNTTQSSFHEINRCQGGSCYTKKGYAGVAAGIINELKGSSLSVAGNLEINCEKKDADKNTTIAIDGGGHFSVENNGSLVINSTGTREYPLIYINGDMTSNGKISINAKNLGDSNVDIVGGDYANRISLVLNSNAIFNLTADGTGNVYGLNGVTVTNPKKLNIDLTANTGANSRAIYSGTVSETSGKTSWDQNVDPTSFTNMNITFGRGGAPTINHLDVYSNNNVLEDTNRYVKKVYVVSDALDTSDNVTFVNDDYNSITNQITGDLTATSGKDNIFLNINIDGTNLPGTVSENDHYVIVSDVKQAAPTNLVKTDSTGHFTVDLNSEALKQYKNLIHNRSQIKLTANKHGHITLATITVDFGKDAKAALDKKEQEYKEKVEALKNLSKEEQQQITEKIHQDVEQAKNAIDGMNDQNQINTYEKTTETGLLKDVAKAVVDDDANRATNSITNNQTLTEPEKTAAKEAVKKYKEAAEGKITAAQDENGITSAQNEGIKTIDREELKEEVEHAAAVEKEKIKNSGLTTEEQTTTNSQVENDVKEAKEKIDSAQDQKAAEQARDNGINTIGKEEAKAEITHESTKVTADIAKDTHLTDGERTPHTTQVTEKVKEALKNIEDAKDAKAVEKAKNEGKTSIDKEGAKAKIEDEAKKVEDTIQKNKTLTSNEQAAAKQKVEADKTEALKNIEDATSQDAVKAAQDEGLKKIDREEAKAEVDHEAKAETDSITKNQTLTEAEKTAAKNKIEEDRKTTDEAIDKAADQEVETIKNKGISKIDREEAKAEVRHEADQVEEKLKTLPNLDQEKAKQEVEKHEQEAETKIDEAQDKNGIDKAKNAGKLQIDQDGAIDAINSEKVKMISEAGDDAKTDITAAADKAIENIKKITVDSPKYKEDIEKEEITGIFNIDITGVISKIKKAAQDADNKIDQDQTLTEDGNVTERKNAKARVDQERDQIIAKIVKEATDALTKPETIADTLKNITAEANDIINTINREPAKADVEHAARVEKEKIKNNSELTEPEKTEAEGKVDTDLTEAEKEIDNAPDNQVDQAAQAGSKKISLENEKATAKEHIKREAVQEKQKINDLKTLTPEEKTKEGYSTNVDTDETNAINAIDNATSSDEINVAEKKGLASIDRESAKAVINNEAKKITGEIEALSNVDEAAKKQAEQKVETDRKQYIDEISDEKQTPDQNSVNSARDIGKQKIDDDGKLASQADTEAKNAKDAAQKELEAAKNKAESEIDSKHLPNLSDKEREDAKQKIEQDFEQAKQAINKAKGQDAVNKEKAKGISNIGQDENRAKAHDAIDKEVKRAEEGINKLSEDAKKTAEDKIKQDAQTAHADVDKATDQKGIDKAQNDGVNSIARDGAIAQINHEAEKVTNDIDGLKNVDPKTQQEAKANVEKDKQDAINKINNPNETVDSIEKDTKEGIDQIDKDGQVAKEADDATSKAKQDADKAIDDQASQAKNAVDKEHLSDQEKEEIKKQIDQDAQKAKDEINRAQGDEGVNKAKESGNTSIKNDVNKAEAKSAINDEADKVKNAVNALPNLTSDEKKEYDDQVDKDAQEAKGNIDKATDQNTVIDAKNKGIVKIDQDGKEAQVKDDLYKAKQDANKAIDDQVTKTKGEVDNNKNLSEQEKKNFKDQVDQTAKKAKDEIEKITDTNDINKAKENGLNNIKQKGTDAKTAGTNKANDSKNSQDNTGKTNTNDGKDGDSNNSHNNGGSTTINRDQSGDSNNGHNNSGLSPMTNDHSNNSDNDHSNSGSTNAKSNGFKANANDAGSMNNRYSSSLGAEDNGEAKAVVIGDKESDSRKNLPQAGAKKEEVLGTIGLAIIAVGSLLGLGISKKRREK